MSPALPTRETVAWVDDPPLSFYLSQLNPALPSWETNAWLKNGRDYGES